MIQSRQLIKAVEVIRQGGLIAYPTEAVWGLGCDPLNGAAVQRLLQLKQRPVAKGLIIVSDSLDSCRHWLAPLTDQQQLALQQSWPGFQTWAIPAAPWVPFWVTGQYRSVAIRISKHPLVQALCKGFGGPIISTSANHAGNPPLQNACQLRRAFGRQLDAIVPGALGGESRPSSIRDLVSGEKLR